MVCTVLLLAANILLTVRIVLGLERLKPCQRESLPCQAVPIRFVMDEPECVDKLLRSMNVSNIHIVPADIPEALPNETALRLQNASEHDRFWPTG